MAIYDTETSSLNEDSRRFNANRRSGISAQTIAITIGKIIVIIAIILLSIYALTDFMSWRSCKQRELNFAPLIERDGVLELSWDSLPTAIRTISNLVIVEHNSQCGAFNLSQLRSLGCAQLTLAYMPHSTFSFRQINPDPVARILKANGETGQRVPCYGIRWIANRLDRYHGPFLDLDDLKQWFEKSTSHEYNGCMGKPGKRIEDARSVVQERRDNGTLVV